MAENKADALNTTNAVESTKLKVYYSCDTPDRSGMETFEVSLPVGARPWLIKEVSMETEDLQYNKSDIVYQFACTSSVYKDLSRSINTILDAVVVNSKQREAVELLVDKALYDRLCTDLANGHDVVL